MLNRQNPVMIGDVFSSTNKNTSIHIKYIVSKFSDANPLEHYLTNYIFRFIDDSNECHLNQIVTRSHQSHPLV